MDLLTALICLLAFLLPWEYVGSFDLFNLTIRPSYLVALVIAGIWLTELARGRRRIKKLPWVWPAGSFLLVEIFSALLAKYPGRAWSVTAFTAFTIFVAWLVNQLITTSEQLKKVLAWLLGGSGLAVAFGFYQYFGDLAGLPTSLTGLRANYVKNIFGFPRLQGPALEPLYFANYLLLPLCLLIAYLLFNQPKKKSWSGLLAFELAAFILTISRSAYLALGGAALLLFAYWLKLAAPSTVFLKLKKLYPLLVSALAGGLLAYFCLLMPLHFQAAQPLNFLTEHSTEFVGTAAYEERLSTGQLARQLFGQQPILGIGPGNFGPYAVQKIYPDWPANQWPIVNNETLELLVETGWLGLITILWLLIIIIKDCWQNRQAWLATDLAPAMLALLAAGLGTIIQYQFFSTLYILPIWFLFGLLSAANYLGGQKNF